MPLGVVAGHIDDPVFPAVGGPDVVVAVDIDSPRKVDGPIAAVASGFRLTNSESRNESYVRFCELIDCVIFL